MLNPDMPIEELRLHMGELTEDESLVARSAIRWANSHNNSFSVSQKNLENQIHAACINDVSGAINYIKYTYQDGIKIC